jgi:hypothetical protein
VANIRKMEQLSAWVEYKLASDLLDPPVLKVRLRHLDALGLVNPNVGGSFQSGHFAAANAIEAVGAWDLCDEGTPIPLTLDNKVLYLRPLLSEVVEGRGMLGLVILEDCQNRELFLKN